MKTYYDAMNPVQPWEKGFMALTHDIWSDTVYNFVPKIIDYVRGRGWRFVTVAECATGNPRTCYQ